MHTPPPAADTAIVAPLRSPLHTSLQQLPVALDLFVTTDWRRRGCFACLQSSGKFLSLICCGTDLGYPLSKKRLLTQIQRSGDAADPSDCESWIIQLLTGTLLVLVLLTRKHQINTGITHDIVVTMIQIIYFWSLWVWHEWTKITLNFIIVLITWYRHSHLEFLVHIMTLSMAKSVGTPLVLKHLHSVSHFNIESFYTLSLSSFQVYSFSNWTDRHWTQDNLFLNFLFMFMIRIDCSLFGIIC